MIINSVSKFFYECVNDKRFTILKIIISIIILNILFQNSMLKTSDGYIRFYPLPQLIL